MKQTFLNINNLIKTSLFMCVFCENPTKSLLIKKLRNQETYE